MSRWFGFADETRALAEKALAEGHGREKKHRDRLEFGGLIASRRRNFPEPTHSHSAGPGLDHGQSQPRTEQPHLHLYCRRSSRVPQSEAGELLGNLTRGFVKLVNYGVVVKNESGSIQ